MPELCELVVTAGHAVRHALVDVAHHLVHAVEDADQEVADKRLDQRERPEDHPPRDAALVVAGHTVVVDVDALGRSSIEKLVPDRRVRGHFIEALGLQPLGTNLFITLEQRREEEHSPLDRGPDQCAEQIGADEVSHILERDGADLLACAGKQHSGRHSEDQGNTGPAQSLIVDLSRDDQEDKTDGNPEQDTAECQ